MNSARRTAPGSHPDSDSAFPFSPGGAARRPFLFLHLPPSPHGAVRAASLSPSRGLRSRGFRGGFRGGLWCCPRSFQRSLRRAGGPEGPPARRLHALLPAPAAGGGFAGFSGGAAVFRGLSAIFRGLPAVLPSPFTPFSGISPVWPPEPCTGFLPLLGFARSGGGGGAQRVPDGPQGPFPCGS